MNKPRTHPEDQAAMLSAHQAFCDRHGRAVIAVQRAAYKLGLERGRKEGDERRRELRAVLYTAFHAFAHDDDGPMWSDALIKRARAVLARPR